MVNSLILFENINTTIINYLISTHNDILDEGAIVLSKCENIIIDNSIIANSTSVGAVAGLFIKFG